jgi:hypothetical protein
MREEKICLCPSGPKLTQVLPSGFKGSVKCAECGGSAVFPRSGKKYSGNDPVEGYLFEIEKNGASFEATVIRMLLRMESQLKSINNFRGKR